VVGVTSGRDRELGRARLVELGSERMVRFIPVARIPPAERTRRLPHSAALVSGCYRFRPRLRADVVHFHRAETALTCHRLLGSAPTVLFLHGAGQAHGRGVGQESFWALTPGFVYKVVERLTVRGAAYTFVTDRSKAALLSRHIGSVSAATNWYDGNVFSPPPDEPRLRPLVIGWFGRFQESKDPLLAVEVFKALAAAGVTFRAWLAGEGPLEGTIRQSLDSAGLSQVEMLGLLSRPELAQRLRASTACLGTSRWEGIPRGLIEALACGVPVVSSDVGDVASVVRPENGVLLQQRAPEVFAHALREAGANNSPRRVAQSVAHLDVRHVVPRLLCEIESRVRLRS
jgi:glycosyltransferase involved in cell wall biosynthesis